MIRKAFLMSVLAKKQPWPAVIISLIASSMVAYRTLVCSGDMPSLTDEPLGKDKWWINLNSPGTFFGTVNWQGQPCQDNLSTSWQPLKRQKKKIIIIIIIS